MSNKPKKSSKKILLILIVLILSLGIYLNRSYAYFFNYLGGHQIVPATPESDARPYFYLPLNSVNTDHDLKYFALGDSLTRGIGVSDDMQAYPFLVGNSIAQKKGRIDYVNLAVPGSTTASLINNQLKFLGDTNPQYLSLLIGINDVLTNVSADQFRTNYQQILDQLLQNKAGILIVINIPDLSGSQIILPPYNFLVDWRTKQFNSIIDSLVEQKNNPNIIYVDLYSQTKLPFSTDQSLYSADHFHPNAKGYQLWSQIIDANLNF